MSPVLEAHVHAMEAARASGELRTIHGHAYPISAGAMQRWQQEQAEIRRQKMRAFLQSKTAARLTAERAFA